MKNSRIFTLALIALLLATPVASGMLVLCFGSDGHVALESANSGLCCREWETTRQEDPEGVLDCPELAQDSCCNDVGVSIARATLTAPVQKVVITATAAASIPDLSQPCGSVSISTIPPLSESSVTASLRTVVIRA